MKHIGITVGLDIMGKIILASADEYNEAIERFRNNTYKFSVSSKVWKNPKTWWELESFFYEFDNFEPICLDFDLPIISRKTHLIEEWVKENCEGNIIIVPYAHTETDTEEVIEKKSKRVKTGLFSWETIEYDEKLIKTVKNQFFKWRLVFQNENDATLFKMTWV